jgi:hypothetical protein
LPRLSFWAKTSSARSMRAKEPWIFGTGLCECGVVSSLLRSGELEFILFTPILEGRLEVSDIQPAQLSPLSSRP